MKSRCSRSSGRAPRRAARGGRTACAGCGDAGYSASCTLVARCDHSHGEDRRDNARAISFGDFHRTPGDTPDIETTLERGALITQVVVPTQPIARRSHYLKVREHARYEFALASAAVAFDLDARSCLTAVEARCCVRPVTCRDSVDLT